MGIEEAISTTVKWYKAGIALQQFGAVQTRAANQAHESNVRILRGAAQMAIMAEGNPDTEITWDGSGGTAVGGEDAEDYGWGTYLESWPEMPDNVEFDEYEGFSVGDGYEVIIAADTGEITVEGTE